MPLKETWDTKYLTTKTQEYEKRAAQQNRLPKQAIYATKPRNYSPSPLVWRLLTKHRPMKPLRFVPVGFLWIFGLGRLDGLYAALCMFLYGFKDVLTIGIEIQGRMSMISGGRSSGSGSSGSGSSGSSTSIKRSSGSGCSSGWSSIFVMVAAL